MQAADCAGGKFVRKAVHMKINQHKYPSFSDMDGMIQYTILGSGRRPCNLNENILPRHGNFAAGNTHFFGSGKYLQDFKEK